MDTKLFDAILSMDSYNRGYNPGISFGPTPTNSPVVNGVTQLGNATIINNSSTALTKGTDQTAGFYSIAYKDNSTGAVVIAYRGTDQFLNGGGIGGDIYNGYGSGSGLTDTPQTELAFRFYQAVANKLSAAYLGIHMVNLAGKAVRRNPLGHSVRIKEGSINLFRLGCENAVQTYSIWH